MLTKFQHCLTLILSLQLIVVSSSFAQDEFDPFAEGAKPPTDVPTSPVTGSSDAIKDDDNPIVQSIIDNDPRSVPQLVRAVKLLMDLDRIDVASIYFKKLVDAGVTDEQAYQIVQEYGTSFLYKIFKNDELAKVGGAFTRKTVVASQRYANDSARLASLVSQLSNPDPSLARDAIKELSFVGPVSVGPMMAALSNKGREAEHPNVHAGLLKLGKSAIPALSAVVQSDNASAKAYAMDVLGRMKSRKAVPILIRVHVTAKSSAESQIAAKALDRILDYVPARETEVQFLRNRFDFLMSQTSFVGDSLDQMTMWKWDSDTKTLSQVAVDTVALKLDEAASIAGTLVELDTDKKAAEKRFLSVSIRNSVRQSGSAAGIAASIDKSKLPMVSELLGDNLSTSGSAEVAIGAVEIMDQIGTAELLQSNSGRPSGLARALSHGNQKLRFAATKAIAKLNPKKSFFGSSKYIEALADFSSTTGNPTVVVAHQSNEMRQVISGMLSTNGYKVLLASDGRSAFAQAVSNSDVEFVVLSVDVSDPSLFELLQEFRRDSRSRRLPIAIVSQKDRLKYADAYAIQDEQTVSAILPVDQEGLKFLMSRVGRIQKPSIGRDEKIARAQVSLNAVLNVLKSDSFRRSSNLRQYEDKFVAALYTPELTSKAAAILGAIGSPKAQKELVYFASSEVNSVETRKECVKAFEAAVKEKGMMLTNAQRLMQYEKYNLSETADAATQSVLGSILDVIERK